MINGAHVIVYSRDAEADRKFFREVLHFPHVDAGHGWLIFALPTAEAAFHPADANVRHELYLMCDDIHQTVADLKLQNVQCGEIHQERWGIVTSIQLPGGGTVGLYEPKHPRPAAP